MSTLSPRARGATEGPINKEGNSGLSVPHTREATMSTNCKTQDSAPDRQAKTFVVERKGRLLFLETGARIMTVRCVGCADLPRGCRHASPFAAAPF
jgi:hypothetical protein